MDNLLIYVDKFFTIQQQTALLTVTLSVMILTQAFKNIYFGFHKVKDKLKRKAIIWLWALICGFGGGMVGHLTAVPPQPIWFWIFSGVSSGGLAIGSFWLIIEVIVPRLTRKPPKND